ncbi:MAG: hypothetical protein JNL58_11695 [Planctomyces sp.]|nr:hypothetical protein [Planctomyces sp.]
MDLLNLRILEASRHLRRQALWNSLSSAFLCAGSLSSAILLLKALLLPSPEGSPAASAVVGLCISLILLVPVVWVIQTSLKKIPLDAAARMIDEVIGLPDSVSTAIAIRSQSRRQQHTASQQVVTQQEAMSPWVRLQLQDTIERLSRNSGHPVAENPFSDIPLNGPRLWPLSLLLMSVSVVGSFLEFNRLDGQQTLQPISAEVTAAELLVQKSTDAISNKMTLPEPATNWLQNSRRDNLLETFSELRSVLESVQAELSGQSQRQILREIGESLQLSEAMASSGRLLADSNWHAAADAIERLQVSEITDPERNAMVRELESVVARFSDSPAADSARPAAEGLLKGLKEHDNGVIREALTELKAQVRLEDDRVQLASQLDKNLDQLNTLRAQALANSGQTDGNRNPGSASPDTGQLASSGTGQLASSGTGQLASSGTGQSASAVAGQLEMDPGRLRSNRMTTGLSKMVIPDGQNTNNSVVPRPTEISAEDQRALREFSGTLSHYQTQLEDVQRSSFIPRHQRNVVRRYFEAIREVTRNVQPD